MTISVIIPCFNVEKTLKRAIESVANQVLLPDEIILVNDCSTDRTDELIRNIKSEYSNLNIIYINLKENGGPGNARNIGWDKANGDYIAFLDADDSWHKDKLLLQRKVFNDNPDIVLCSTMKENRKESGLDLEIKHIEVNYIKFNLLLIKNVFSTPTVMIKRDIDFRFPLKKFSEDYMLWLLIAAKYPRGLVRINNVLVYLYKMDYGDNGLSSNLWLMEKGEIENYIELYKKNIISIFTLVGTISFSLFKYIIRILKCKLRQ